MRRFRAFLGFLAVCAALLASLPVDGAYSQTRGLVTPGLKVGVRQYGFPVRVAPDTADSFYVVVRTRGNGGDAVHFQRNVGGTASASNLGVQWPEWRPTGRAQLATFESAPTSPTLTYYSDTGAQGLVAANASQKFFTEFHGLGLLGSLNSEAVTGDGNALDPTVASRMNVFAVQNSTTATDAVTTLTRDMTTSLNGLGALQFTVNSISGTAISYLYAGMLTGSGNYDEFDVRQSDNGPWIAVPPMGLGNGNSYTLPSVGVKGVRLRDTSTGRSVTITGPGSAFTSYVRSETERTSVNDRLKSYFGRFTDPSALVGLTWSESAQIGPLGSQFAKTNQLVNGDFATGDLTGWTKVNTGAVGTPTVVSGAMREVREVGLGLRMRQTAGNTVATSDLLAYQMDLIALSAGAAPIARLANATTLPASGALVSQNMSGIGRNTFLLMPDATGPYYAGDELSAGTAGQTADVDNFGLWKVN